MLTKVCKCPRRAGQGLGSGPGGGLQQQEMEAGRQESFGKKESKCEHIVKTPFSSTASCLWMRHPLVLKELSQVPVFLGPQLLRWVFMLHLIKHTEESPSLHQTSASFPASAVCRVGTGSYLNRTNVDASPDSSPSVD